MNLGVMDLGIPRSPQSDDISDGISDGISDESSGVISFEGLETLLGCSGAVLADRADYSRGSEGR
ncbi:MAG: hypothetical protein HC857_16220, partial [Synechococcales cyanobacterium RU_4_20]|nr:hypothetical protein [Synechococcales cyanobacterium RU_4_20]